MQNLLTANYIYVTIISINCGGITQGGLDMNRTIITEREFEQKERQGRFALIVETWNNYRNAKRKQNLRHMMTEDCGGNVTYWTVKGREF